MHRTDSFLVAHSPGARTGVRSSLNWLLRPSAPVIADAQSPLWHRHRVPAMPDVPPTPSQALPRESSPIHPVPIQHRHLRRILGLGAPHNPEKSAILMRQAGIRPSMKILSGSCQRRNPPTPISLYNLVPSSRRWLRTHRTASPDTGLFTQRSGVRRTAKHASRWIDAPVQHRRGHAGQDEHAYEAQRHQAAKRGCHDRGLHQHHSATAYELQRWWPAAIAVNRNNPAVNPLRRLAQQSEKRRRSRPTAPESC